MEQTACAGQAVSVSPPSWYCSTLECIIQSFRRGNVHKKRKHVDIYGFIRRSRLVWLQSLCPPAVAHSLEYRQRELQVLKTTSSPDCHGHCGAALVQESHESDALDFWLTAQSKAEGPSFGGRCKRLGTKPMSFLTSKPTEACISSLTVRR